MLARKNYDGIAELRTRQSCSTEEIIAFSLKLLKRRFDSIDIDAAKP